MNAPRDWTLLCLSCGAVVALSRLFSLYTVYRVPGYLGTWVPGYLGTWVPGYLGTWAPGKTRTFLFAKTRTLFRDNTYTFCVRVIANRKKKYTCYRNLPIIILYHTLYVQKRANITRGSPRVLRRLSIQQPQQIIRYGQKMSQEQAYRDLCHQYHGKEPSKKSQEKEAKRWAERQAAMHSAGNDKAMEAAAGVRRAQEASGAAVSSGSAVC